ncbi:hypothetical protein HFP72_00410 [Nocardiopsis sp. ARC36]
MTSPFRTPSAATTAALAAAALLAGCSAAVRPGSRRGRRDPLGGRRRTLRRGLRRVRGPDLPEAADGTDLEACADAECEVLVEAGDEFAMDGTHGVDRFVVDAVDGEGLGMSGFGPGIELSGTSRRRTAAGPPPSS